MKPIRSDLPNEASPQDHLDDVRLVVCFTGVPTGDVREVSGGIVVQWDAIGVPEGFPSGYSRWLWLGFNRG